MNQSLSSFSTRATPQGEPVGGANTRNNAGGFVFAIDKWKTFERFLLIGTEGGSYYIGEANLTKVNAEKTIECIKEDGPRAVRLIEEISHAGRAPKNDPALFALALAASVPEAATRKLALAALPKVARIPTHLFHFLTYVQNHRGWGRGLKKAVAAWYNDLPVDKLAYEVVKYQSRDGFSNRDAIRLSHPKTKDEVRNFIYSWIVDDFKDARKAHPIEDNLIPKSIAGFEFAKEAPLKDIPNLIGEYGLTREMIPTEALSSPEVWEALLENMGSTTLIRNLGNMSRVGLLTESSIATKIALTKLLDQEALHKARVHPIEVLIALKTYASGSGVLGKNTWKPVRSIVSALDDAFYLAFKNLTPTGKRLLFAIDCSESMLGSGLKGYRYSDIPGTKVSPAEAAASLALACAKFETEYYIMGFADKFRHLPLKANMALDMAVAATQSRTFGRTDCALPMVWALEQQVEVDAFIVLTDNETWVGRIHPHQALRAYREKMGRPAKEIVMAMTATSFSIADPSDPFALDIAGFDASCPSAIAEFVKA